ncbi:MAG: septal ring lytic transglycosylase RlpA family protein [bacterium]|nr:septal ring lytic transglycosylase RlpA family protein [bacterium]
MRKKPEPLFRLLVLGLLALAGCAAADPVPVRTNLPAGEFRGLASWYGRTYHGKPTASGEPYDMEALTAAHRTLPFHSRVLVRRTDTGRAIEVRINDRGPFFSGRVIDLSRRAARELAMIGKGTAPVRLVPLYVPAERNVRWKILAGPFPSRRAAERFASVMNNRQGKVSKGWDGDMARYRVQLNRFSDRWDAQRTLSRIRGEGHQGYLIRSR